MLVRLEQFFMGNIFSSTRYVYQASDDTKIGDLVCGEGISTYVGRVVEINVKPILELDKYKYTTSCDKEYAFNFLVETYLTNETQYYSKEYDKVMSKGGYYDPNYGWVDCHDVDFDPDETREDHQKLAEEWANEILNEWRVNR